MSMIRTVISVLKATWANRACNVTNLVEWRRDALRWRRRDRGGVSRSVRIACREPQHSYSKGVPRSFCRQERHERRWKGPHHSSATATPPPSWWWCYFCIGEHSHSHLSSYFRHYTRITRNILGQVGWMDVCGVIKGHTWGTTRRRRRSKKRGALAVVRTVLYNKINVFT